MWSKRRGKCVSASPPKKCVPACKSGERCRRGKCVASGGGGEQKPPPKAGKVSGRILNLWPSPKGTTLLINRGSNHGVKRGSTGTISGGGSFKVTEVFPFQCRGVTKLSRDQLGTRRKVTIKP